VFRCGCSINPRRQTRERRQAALQHPGIAAKPSAVKPGRCLAETGGRKPAHGRQAERSRQVKTKRGSIAETNPVCGRYSRQAAERQAERGKPQAGRQYPSRKRVFNPAGRQQAETETASRVAPAQAKIRRRRQAGGVARKNGAVKPRQA